MKLKGKKLIAAILAMFMILWLVPNAPGWESKVYAANSDSSPYMRYEAGFNQIGWDNLYGSYRLWGTVNGNEKATTYEDEGWRIELRDGAGNSAYVGIISNGVEKTVYVNGVPFGFTLNLSFINAGRYVKVEFAVRNTTNVTQVISIGSIADIKIGENDAAQITQFDDGSGFYMDDGDGARFSFIGKNAYGVTDVDTFWFGYTEDMHVEMYQQVTQRQSPPGLDTGMAFSWKNRTIQPGATNKYSVLIGIGEVSAPPVLTLFDEFAPGGMLPPLLPGSNLSVSGTVSDLEKTAGTQLYYAIDDREPISFYTFPGEPGSFTASITLPNDLVAGNHTIKIYAQDIDGAISSATTKIISLLNTSMYLAGHDLVYLAGANKQKLDNNFVVNYNGNITGGKIYIASGRNGFLDSLYFSDVGGVSGNYVSTTGVLTMTGVSNAEGYQTFIRNVSLATTNYKVPKTIVVNLFTEDKKVIYNPANGHYYEFVEAKGISYSDAKAAAEARTHNGVAGYLAKLSDAEEKDFLYSIAGGGIGWIGYEQTDGSYGQLLSQDGQIWHYPDYFIDADGYFVEYGTSYLPPEGSVCVINVTFLDTTAPTFNIVGIPTSWTNSDVTITVNAADNSSGLHDDGAYSFNNGPWTNNPTYTVSGNQTINVRVRDNAGNIASTDVVVDKIDKTAPTFTHVTPSKETWTTDPITLTVHGLGDMGSGLHALPYSFSTQEGVYNWQSSPVSPEYHNNQTVYIYVRDALGNISFVYTVTIDNIDTTLPNAPVIQNGDSFTSSRWFNQGVTVSASFTQTTGFAEKLQYQINDGEWIDGSYKTFLASGIYTLSFRVIDAAGRTSPVQTCVVQIDKENPVVEAPDKNYNWRKEDFSVELTFEDVLSGIGAVQFNLTNSTHSPSTWLSWLVSNSVLISEEGIWYLHYCVTDKAGNTATGYFGPYKLDKTAPQGVVVGNPATWYQSDVLLTVEATDNLSGLAAEAYSFDNGATWQASNCKTFTQNTEDIRILVRDAAGNVYVLDPVSITNIDKIAPGNAAIVAPENYGADKWHNTNQTVTATFTPTPGCNEKLQYKVNSCEWTDGATVTFAEEGIYTVSFRVIDELGRTSAEQTVVVNIDKTAPAGTITVKENAFKQFINTITFGLFFKENVDVNISADTDLSGIASIKYHKSATALTGEELQELDSKDWIEAESFSIAPNEKCVIYARITDNAGNVSVINTDGIVVYTDSVIPEKSAYFDIDENRVGYTDITVEIELNDNTLAAIKLGEAVLEKGVDYTVDGNVVTLKKEYLKTVVDGTVTFTFIFAPMGETFEEGTAIGDAPLTQEFTAIQITHAAAPEFVTDLSGTKKYYKGDAAAAIGVEATAKDGGQITYQWYVNGVAIDGATQATYTPDTSSNGVYDYYVVATNTNAEAIGDKTATTQSGTYRVVVSSAQVARPQIDNGAPDTNIQDDAQAVLEAVLTDEDRTKLENGYDISVILKVLKVTSAPQGDADAVNRIIGDNVLGLYVDISLVKTLVDPQGNSTEQAVTNLNAPLTITIDIPEDMLPKHGEVRTFRVIRVHDGVATILEDLDDNPNTITIRTDRFSTYTIVYKDAAVEDPDTGDTQPVMAYAIGLAALGCLVIYKVRRREVTSK